MTFQPFVFAENTNTAVTIGNFTINPGSSTSSNTALGTTAAPYGNLPAATRNLFQSGTFSQLDQITLTMRALAIGQAYTFQFWVNNAGNFTNYGYQVNKAYSGTSATGAFGQAIANTSVPGSTMGGVGQFITGTFTADAASQSVFFSTRGQDYAVLNAFQLRTGNVPESGTWALLGAAGRRRGRARPDPAPPGPRGMTRRRWINFLLLAVAAKWVSVFLEKESALRTKRLIHWRRGRMNAPGSIPVRG